MTAGNYAIGNQTTNTIIIINMKYNIRPDYIAINRSLNSRSTVT